MKKWEYNAYKQPAGVSMEVILAILSEMGRQGWRMCGIDYGYFFFVREAR